MIRRTFGAMRTTIEVFAIGYSLIGISLHSAPGYELTR